MNRLVCRTCQENYLLDDPRWKCACGGLLDISFTPVFDLEKIERRKNGLWRYREAIPLREDAHIVSLGEGMTPMLPVDFGGRQVWIKQDQLFPTGSYKDRGAAVLVSKARELGIREVVEDSSGNAGCAVAAFCAAAGIACSIFVPEATSAGKLAQIQLYGARLNRVPGDRENTARAVLQAAEKVYYASHSWNPFFFQGTKTFAFEVCEQLGWHSPDAVILPVGNGTLLLGAAIGFNELLEAGITRKIPKLIAVQAETCAPLTHAFRGEPADPAGMHTRDTLAEGIAIAAPVRAEQILQAVRKSRGTFVTVTDTDIEASLKDIGRKGFYIEPTSAATTAGIVKYLPTAPPGNGRVGLHRTRPEGHREDAEALKRSTFNVQRSTLNVYRWITPIYAFITSQGHLPYININLEP